MKRWMLLALILLFLCGCQRKAEPPQPSPSPTPDPETVDAPEQPPAEEAPVQEVVLLEPEIVYADPAFDGPEEEPTRQFSMNEGQARVYEREDVQDGCRRLRRQTGLPNGDVVTMGRVFTSPGELEVDSFQFQGGGRISYYDRTGGMWVRQPVEPCTLGAGMVELELEDGGSWLLYLPKTYVCRENSVLEYLPQQNGQLRITEDGDQWTVSLLGTAPEGMCVCDYMTVCSAEPLLDWSHPNCESLWPNYAMEGSGKWCYDGFYWPCPYNYEPTGENYMYRCPASYLVKSFAFVASAFRAAEDLSTAMLDALSQAQNEAGYWETSPKSGWLSTDYGIGAGFYDTRFNTDLMEIYVRVYNRVGGEEFRETMERYAAFYTAFAESHHFETENGGWFVEDYFHPDGGQPAHCSLNHQAAECILLYHLSDVLGRPELSQLAERLLQAIRDTASSWINGVGDLHYCVYPNGTYGNQDYPYLTYNDLFNLQAILLEKTGAEDEALAYLMDAKRNWMDQNGVTDYKK